jgi:hypothetical protein
MPIPNMMAPNISPIRNAVSFRWFVRLLAVWAGWSFTMGMEQARADAGVSEYDVKAAFIAKFPEFVKWPSSRGPMTVGIVGQDPFGGELGKLIKVKRANSVEDLKDCQIIFIPKSERGNTGAILGSLAGANILTVGESEGFARQGGVIGFVMDGDKVRFQINTGAAQRAGLTIKVQLLKLAMP